MQMSRAVWPMGSWTRRLRQLACLLLAAVVLVSPLRAQTRTVADVTLSVPGPGNSVSMPLELAVKLGLDRAEGVALRLKFVGGGGVALRDLAARNSDYAVFGLPAAIEQNVPEIKYVGLAALDDLPLYTLVVRNDLRGKVRQVADLKNMVVGIHSNSLQTKTTSHQVADLLLRENKVPLDSVRYVAAGQSWETQSSAMISQSVDASMCDEPFATRLAKENLAFPLFSTGNPADAASLPGGGFLRATLIARRDVVAADPELAGRMVAIVRASLQWIATHSAEQIADALRLAAGAERDAFIDVFRRFPRQYSRDGKFSTAQLRETEIFFRASTPEKASAGKLSIESMVVDRWAGRKP